MYTGMTSSMYGGMTSQMQHVPQSLLAQAIAVLNRYGGSLWVSGPAYTFTNSDGTGAAGDNSDTGYVRDLCGNARPLTQATTGFKPKLRLLSGRWAWVFDGVDDWISITGAPASPATAHTMGAAAYASTVASRCSLLAMRNTGNNTPLDALEINTGQPTWRQRNDAAATVALSGDAFPANAKLVVSMRSDGANALLRQNGVQKSTSATAAGAITVNNLSMGIGRGASVVDPLNGGIFAAFYAPAAIPNAEMLIVEKAIAQLGGITI